MQSNLQWYVFRSKPNKEMTLWQELTVQGFDCFYPQLRLRPVNPRSRRVRPYFPGYLFLHTNVEQVGASMFRWMPFSNGILTFGDVLATVPHNLVQAIRRHVEEINALGAELLSGWKQGDDVRINGGPFDGYQAIFAMRLPGQERVRVLLKLLQVRQMSLELPAAQIQRSGASPR